jgi:hypothetical protein
MKFPVVMASIAAVASASAGRTPGSSPQFEMIAKHQLLARSMNGTAVEDSSPAARAATTGSVIYSFHADGDTCQKEAGSGNGYVFGGCVSVDGSTGE